MPTYRRLSERRNFGKRFLYATFPQQRQPGVDSFLNTIDGYGFRRSQETDAVGWPCNPPGGTLNLRQHEPDAFGNRVFSGRLHWLGPLFAATSGIRFTILTEGSDNWQRPVIKPALDPVRSHSPWCPILSLLVDRKRTNPHDRSYTH